MAITSAISMSDWSRAFELKLNDFEIHKKHELYSQARSKLEMISSNPIDKAMANGNIQLLCRKIEDVKSGLSQPDCLEISLKEHEFRLIQDLAYFMGEIKGLEPFEGDVGSAASFMETVNEIAAIANRGFIFEGRISGFRYILLDEQFSKGLGPITVFQEKPTSKAGQTKWEVSIQKPMKAKSCGDCVKMSLTKKGKGVETAIESTFLSTEAYVDSLESWSKLRSLFLPVA